MRVCVNASRTALLFLAFSVYTIVRRLYGHRLPSYILPSLLRSPLAIRQVSQLPAKPINFGTSSFVTVGALLFLIPRYLFLDARQHVFLYICEH